MKGTNTAFNQYVGEWMSRYRSKMAYTMERMSEKLQEDSRSYADHEKGIMGFSGYVLGRFMAQMEDEEILDFVRGMRRIVWPEEFENVG